ncbi:FkbM family methyltransferase [Paenibacillus sp.]|jgi:FkbM family methyltransferase|uniref:FkbM family methyltransferase n=1 Tax=Paenibacillus sp. TaxID=58172 RepID=UPI00282BA482|nr:FkbM family methyltransferase [Paenibacillus sp.]MDR0268703.1 FkbM family methyltransferase [Paenibacillus sp.]
MYGTYIGNNKMLVKLAYNAMITVPADDLSLMPSFVTSGMIEAPLTNYFLTQIKPGFTVVDIGANVGYFTVLASKMVGNSGKVFAYEASSKTAAILKDNLAINWTTENVKVINKAIYSENKLIKFHSSERFIGNSSLHERPSDENVLDTYTTKEIEAVALDNELKNIDSIDLVKIDIEGGEYHALLGMMGLLHEKKIKRVTFEWNKIMLGDVVEKFLLLMSDILNSLGGRIYLLNKEGEPVPTTLKEVSNFEFYPFVLIEF